MTRHLIALLAAALPGLGDAGDPHSQLPAAWVPVARETLAELIRIDTTHEKGSTAAAEAIARRLRSGGFDPADLTLCGPLPHKQNLVVRLRGTGDAAPLLFVGHLDVVSARREDWSRDPFVLGEEDGFFYGRGSSDMKGDDAALVVALLRLRAERYRPDRDVVVAFTDDEERGGIETNGVRWLLEHRPELVRSGLAIDPEVGGGDLRRGRRMLLDVQTSEKIYASFRLESKDRGGHSSVPHAQNPIHRIAAAVARVAALEFPVHLNDTTRGYFAALATQETGRLAEDLAALGRSPTDLDAARRVAASSDVFAALMRTTCVATEVSGGHAENALPQTAVATVNCRILPDEAPDDVEATLRKVIADPGVELSRKTEVRLGRPSPLDPAVLEPVRRVAGEVFPGVPIAPIMSTGASDALLLRAAGIPSYGVGGMFGDVDDVRAHGKDERVGVGDFYDGVEFTYRVVKALTSGPPRR